MSGSLHQLPSSKDPHFQDTSIKRCDQKGWTALHIVVDEGHEDIIRCLVGE